MITWCNSLWGDAVKGRKIFSLERNRTLFERSFTRQVLYFRAVDLTWNLLPLAYRPTLLSKVTEQCSGGKLQRNKGLLFLTCFSSCLTLWLVKECLIFTRIKCIFLQSRSTDVVPGSVNRPLPQTFHKMHQELARWVELFTDVATKTMRAALLTSHTYDLVRNHGN